MYLLSEGCQLSRHFGHQNNFITDSSVRKILPSVFSWPITHHTSQLVSPPSASSARSTLARIFHKNNDELHVCDGLTSTAVSPPLLPRLHPFLPCWNLHTWARQQRRSQARMNTSRGSRPRFPSRRLREAAFTQRQLYRPPPRPPRA